jgi:type I restriction enzyme M protein
MALKKSELYSKLWTACDELRGAMDASQYKDYVLVLLFIKYVSDKYAGVKFAPIVIPPGASFADMVALKGNPKIGQLINTQIIAQLEKANPKLLSDFPDFNDDTKLGSDKDKQERLTSLIGIFEGLDFSKNRADGDDILGDAYEYLMRHFATESGKSKGQFYTPAEVSLIMAKVIGINTVKASNDTTVYDPTCGSGSLLLKVGHEANAKVSLYGQEFDAATSGLARMNMVLHDNPGAVIELGNSIADPKFKDGSSLKTFDFCVANPPFSNKTWSRGIIPESDEFGRFKDFGTPPAKQGDYAFLLHVICSLKSKGKGAIILPHGVLFRGNAEAEIRKNLLKRGYIKAIIGLPANLFYGTGIPACIIVIDKEDADKRKGVFMMDASKGFMKDGNKNRLRERDIHRIVDTFTKQSDEAKFARMVPVAEIADPKNDYNLNLPRYIDTTEPEDLQDIDGHLRGGIPERDLTGEDSLIAPYWKVLPSLYKDLFESAGRPGYVRLKIQQADVKAAILGHPEFVAFQKQATKGFTEWRQATTPRLNVFGKGRKPKLLIAEIAESLLQAYGKTALVDAYDVYQHLMDYWAGVMQDDAYLISIDGWAAKTRRIQVEDKKGKIKDKGWTCDLVPKDLVIKRYFSEEKDELEKTQSALEIASAALAELEDEHGSDDGILGSLEKITPAEVNVRLKEIKNDKEAEDEAAVLNCWLGLAEKEAAHKRAIREQDADLDRLAYAKYPNLTEADIKTLIVDDKWMVQVNVALQGELGRVSQTLTGRIRLLSERYQASLPQLNEEVAEISVRVDGQLNKMGAIWK